MPQRILLIIESSETGGAESMFLELVRRLDRRHWAPHVALLYEGWLLDRLREIGDTPLQLPTRKGPFDFALLHGLARTIRNYHIDLVHSHLFATNLYSSTTGALLGVPVISTFHGTMDVSEHDRLKNLKWKVINRFSRRVVFVSDYLRRHFVACGLASPQKAEVVYNGVDIERFRHTLPKLEARSKLGVSPTGFVIGCVGDIRPAKGYETALRAVSLLTRHIPELTLLICGTPTPLQRDLESLAESLGLRNKAHFLGFRSDIERVLPAFDVYLSSSVSEGFSLTVVEAMAAGIPVVATRSGGPDEIIRNRETGLLENVGSHEDIAAAILSLYRDPSLRAALSDAARNDVEKRFSIGTMIHSYQRLYQQCVRAPV